jgi:hypothetical protein
MESVAIEGLFREKCIGASAPPFDALIVFPARPGPRYGGIGRRNPGETSYSRTESNGSPGSVKQGGQA